jgi:hypothetical protein
MEDCLQSQEIVKIWETAEEKQLPLGQLKYSHLQFAKEHFQGHVFINQNTGRPIRVSKDGIMEWWKKARRREHIISIKLLNFFLENAALKKDNSDYKNRPEIERASLFECECLINNIQYQALITTRKAVTDIDKLRYYSIKKAAFG